MACNRCKGTSSDPFNFLLSCSECGKNWHHRCHIPPLADPELVALLRATNENDVDNGLSSWIGRCCRRKRVRAAAEAMPPEAPVDSAPPAPPVDIRQPRSLSVSAEPEIVVNEGFPQKAAPLHGPNLKQPTAGRGVAAPPNHGDEGASGDLGFHKRVGGGSQATSVQPTVEHVGVDGSTRLILPEIVPTLPPQSTPPPASSATFAPPSSHNRPPTYFSQYARPPHLRESSAALKRKSESSSQLVETTHIQTTFSRFPKRPTSVRVAGNASTSMDTDPPTLDLRGLSLNRATRASKDPPRLILHRATESSRPPSPSPTPRPLLPPVKSEDSEIEDLYAPIREPQRRRSLSPQLPSESEPHLLPALAAKDPHVLAVLERQELREAARPRQGRRKSQPVQGAGKRRAGFVLVEGLTARPADQKSRRVVSRK